MTPSQAVLLAAAFVLILGSAVAAQWWGLRNRIVIFVIGCLSVVCLWIANLPPKWFQGSWTGFGLALVLIAASFAGRTADEVSYRLPMLLGMGLTLLVANVARFVLNVL